MTPLTSAELNYLIFRHLNESGYTHSAFAFEYEAGISESAIDGNAVPPGALVTFIQKGIEYLGKETKPNNVRMSRVRLSFFLSFLGDLDANGSFQFRHPIELITKDGSDHELASKRENEPYREMIEIGKKTTNGIEKENPLDDITDANHNEDEINGRLEENEADRGKENFTYFLF
ncbi:PREDICTED: uncharacterized protein LOC105958752 [Erythranthe guttata]|uniref:uncharacterized protein LOC105958752 n=1 Tax=Erythranthe guttata TaxID=4155 RepID=UPI00064DA84C|nr:PREDICTED: uncharacterized protein LOC105958752 [Erythranthe guttata]|eukprot:XP_012838210.1 PREDICTED: uncharacterized protein LOC105958752 [Erythranthe guttata]